MCVNTRARSGLWNDDNCNDEFGFICERSNGTATPLNPVPTPRIQGGCPPGFSGLDNKCFYVNSTAALGWEAARNACRSMVLARPADIASITSHQELVLVMSLLENVTTDVYIGLNDRQTNAHFVWQTNEEVVLTNWAPNQPSERWRLLGGSSEDCVVMRVQLDIFGQWDDVSCVEKHGYVCQTTRDPSYSMESPVIGGCKGNYYHYRDSCYGNYRMPKNMAEAEATCVLDNGHLVSIRDIHELASVDIFLYIDVVVSASWIGLTYNETTGSYSWVDQWPVTFTQWGQGEPDITKSAACVAMADGKWNDTDCNDLRPFTCKISTAAPPTTTPAPPGYCASPSWAPNGDYCYYAAPSNTQSWPEANYICRKLGMELLSLHSADELSFVQSLVTLAVTTPRYNWRLPSSGVTKVWIGLERTLQGGFRWSDGSPTNYLPWNTGEPNNENDNEDCAEVLISVGKFNDMPCMGISQGFVCKAPKVFPTSTTTTTPSQTTTAESVTSKTTTGTQASTRRLGWPNYRPLVSPATRRTKNSLSGGEIAGIVIGLLAFIAIVGTVVYVLRHRRVIIKPPAEREEPSAGFDNALYDKTHDQVALASNGVHLNHADSEDC
ncbi:macrophage mannose receptor 1-like [Pomacea canaliculata]|uniref:macrophage mannose receptor 1-like n=1 Tax=Pomacea canaliculata TaxID=400727 RepID=UPI000D73A4FD|nr:macrophage mannose receptor 1-like [Pomacea canaliculata]